MNVLDFETLFRLQRRAELNLSIEAAGQLGKGMAERFIAAAEGREVPGAAVLKRLRNEKRLARSAMTKAKRKFPHVYESWLSMSKSRSVAFPPFGDLK